MAGRRPVRAGPRTWLYAIATNVCLDVLRSMQRRATAVDLAPPARPGAPLPEHRWVPPIPGQPGAPRR